MNTYNTEDILKLFKNKYKNDEFRGNTVELQNIHFICDKDYIVREPNYDYAKREIEWYESQSLNVNDIPGNKLQHHLDISIQTMDGVFLEKTTESNMNIV